MSDVNIVFWSWQSDSPSKENRNFIEDCIKKAIRRLNRTTATLLDIDRDTKGVGGTPAISDTILKKIKSCDLFIWDATIVSTEPKPSPNANVLLELGYAVACLGWERMIGVMNTESGHQPESLPFHLKHRRGAITYVLSSDFSDEKRAQTKEALIKDLQNAVTSALQEPKTGAFHSDVNLLVARRLWSEIDSDFLLDWWDQRTRQPQYEQRKFIDVFNNYLYRSTLPERRFEDEILAGLHNDFMCAIAEYMSISSTEMVKDLQEGYYVISTKASERFIEDYSAKYSKQTEKILNAAKIVWEKWNEYVKALSSLFPIIIDS